MIIVEWGGLQFKYDYFGGKVWKGGEAHQACIEPDGTKESAQVPSGGHFREHRRGQAIHTKHILNWSLNQEHYSRCLS